MSYRHPSLLLPHKGAHPGCEIHNQRIGLWGSTALLSDQTRCRDVGQLPVCRVCRCW